MILNSVFNQIPRDESIINANTASICGSLCPNIYLCSLPPFLFSSFHFFGLPNTIIQGNHWVFGAMNINSKTNVYGEPHIFPSRENWGERCNFFGGVRSGWKRLKKQGRYWCAFLAWAISIAPSPTFAVRFCAFFLACFCMNPFWQCVLDAGRCLTGKYNRRYVVEYCPLSKCFSSQGRHRWGLGTMGCNAACQHTIMTHSCNGKVSMSSRCKGQLNLALSAQIWIFRSQKPLSSFWFRVLTTKIA